MKASAAVTATAGPDGRTRLPVLRSQAPLVLRRTPGAVHLVSAAGGPLGGDELALDIEVQPGALLRLHSVAATVALPGRGGWSSLRVRAVVAAGARLEWLPEPTVVSDGASHRSRIEVQLEDGAQLLLRDELVLGRTRERGGRAEVTLDVTLGRAALLRSQLGVDGTDPDTWGPAVLAGHRCAGSLLDVTAVPVDDDRPRPNASDDEGWVRRDAGGVAAAQSLARPTASTADDDIPRGRRSTGTAVLVSALAHDATSLRRLLEGRPGPGGSASDWSGGRTPTLQENELPKPSPAWPEREVRAQTAASAGAPTPSDAPVDSRSER